MSWDFRLNENWDLSPGEVTGSDEVMQRLKLRLLRELGEWFLDTTAGLPWYQDGHGMLGAKMSQQNNALLLIRRCVMDTEGVKAIEKLTTRYILGNRTFSVYIRVILTDRTVRELTLPVTASTFAA
jgi:hypothetical protein